VDFIEDCTKTQGEDIEKKKSCHESPFTHFLYEIATNDDKFMEKRLLRERIEPMKAIMMTMIRSIEMMEKIIVNHLNLMGISKIMKKLIEMIKIMKKLIEMIIKKLIKIIMKKLKEMIMKKLIEMVMKLIEVTMKKLIEMIKIMKKS
jgi:hypothetical protein